MRAKLLVSCAAQGYPSQLFLIAVSSSILAQLDDSLSSFFEILRASDEDDYEGKVRDINKKSSYHIIEDCLTLIGPLPAFHLG